MHQDLLGKKEGECQSRSIGKYSVRGSVGIKWMGCLRQISAFSWSNRVSLSRLSIKLKLLQEPHVVFVEEANVVDAITDHRDAFDAEAERPAGPDFGIVADVLEDLRMHHAAAGDLQPVLAHLLHERVGEINLVARLGVAEVVRAETNLHVAAHDFLEDEFHRALEVADGHAFVHVKTLDLVEGWIV